MRTLILASLAAVAIAAPAQAQSDAQLAAWTVSYIKASNAGATFFDLRNCTSTRCTGVYDAAATINGVDGYVQDNYTIRLGRGSAWSLNDDRWHRITKQQVQDDLDGGRPSKRHG